MIIIETHYEIGAKYGGSHYEIGANIFTNYTLFNVCNWKNEYIRVTIF